MGASSKRNACSMLAKRSPRLLPSAIAAVWTGKDESSGSGFESRAERAAEGSYILLNRQSHL